MESRQQVVLLAVVLHEALVFFKASPITIEPFLQDLARPGFLPVWVGFFAGKANDQVILHDVVNGVALHVHEQEKRKRERGENIW